MSTGKLASVSAPRWRINAGFLMDTPPPSRADMERVQSVVFNAVSDPDERRLLLSMLFQPVRPMEISTSGRRKYLK